MRAVRWRAVLVTCLGLTTVMADTAGTDLPHRQELRRVDLTASPNMQVITSISEIRKVEMVRRHLHHGIETGYVLQGTLVQFPGKPPTRLATGTSVLTLRDVPHGGFTVVGPQSLKLYSVHVVDKGKPLYEWVDAARR